jgi:hypothetical protein
MEGIIYGQVPLCVAWDRDEIYHPILTQADALAASESDINGLRLAAFRR